MARPGCVDKPSCNRIRKPFARGWYHALAFALTFAAALGGPSGIFAATTPIRLSDPDHTNYRQQIAVEGKHVYVVWEDAHVGLGDVFIARSDDKGATFPQDERLNISNTPGNSVFPQVAASGQYVFVAWRETIPYGGDHVLLAYSTDHGMTFSIPVDLSACPYGPNIDFGSVQLAASGNTAHLTWSQNAPCNQNDPVVSGMYVTYKYLAVTTQGANTGGFRFTEAQGQTPHLAVSGSNVYLAWKEIWYSPSLPIYFAASTDNGQTFNIFSFPFAHASTSWPGVIASGNNVYVYWSEVGTGNSFVLKSAASTSQGGNFNDPSFTPTNLTASLSVDWAAPIFSGNKVYLFGKTPSSSDFLFWRSTDGGATFGSPITLFNNFSMNDHFALTASGRHVHVVHTSANTSPPFEISYRESTDGGASFGLPQNISGTPGVQSDNPKLAAFESDAYVTWREVEDPWTQVYVARATEAADRPRVVLLMDTSGSMAWRHDGFLRARPEEQRLTLAKNAADAFLVVLEDHGTDQADFGIARFPHSPQTVCQAQVVTPITPVTAANIATARSVTLPGLAADGSTPLLAGVRTANSMLGAAVNEAIVLLSDGYHNCPDLGADIINSPAGLQLMNELLGNNVRVFTIGFGRPADVDHPLLEGLADGTTPPDYPPTGSNFPTSQFYDVTTAAFDPLTWDPATALMKTYLAILADALGLVIGPDPSGTIPAGGMKNFEVSLTEHDKRVSFFVGWVTSQPNRLSLTVRSSDGQEVPKTEPGVSFHQAGTYQVLTVHESFLKQAGKVGSKPWQVVIAGPSQADKEEPYFYTVLMDSALKMRVAFDKPSYATGERMTLTAALTEQDKPVTGLKQVTMTVSGPEEGRGNWFVQHPVGKEELNKVPEQIAKERLSPRQRMARYLTDVKKVPFPSRTSPVQIRLYDDGSHGDATAGDGVYTGQYDQTAKEGTYAFYVQAAGQTGGGRAFVRENTLQKYLMVNVAPEHVAIDVAPPTKIDRRWVRHRITVTPKDALGNFLGPGYAAAIRLTSTEGNFVGTMQDNLDGTYSQPLVWPAQVDLKPADLSVDLRYYRPAAAGAPTGPAQPAKPAPVLPNWLFAVLVVLAIVVLWFVLVGMFGRARR